MYQPHEEQEDKNLTPSEQLPMLQKLEILCGIDSKMGEPRQIHTEHKIDTDAKTGDRDIFSSSSGDDIIYIWQSLENECGGLGVHHAHREGIISQNLVLLHHLYRRVYEP